MSDKTLETASDAYIYFYPIVENLKTLFFASVWPHTSSYVTPVNQFFHSKNLVDWRFTSIVSPNNDTLYSTAWLYLEGQPIVLSLPDVPGQVSINLTCTVKPKVQPLSYIYIYR